MQNEIDRFNLVKEVIYNLKGEENLSKYASIIQEMNNKLVDHKEYIAEYGEDMPEVKNWKW